MQARTYQGSDSFVSPAPIYLDSVQFLGLYTSTLSLSCIHACTMPTLCEFPCMKPLLVGKKSVSSIAILLTAPCSMVCSPVYMYVFAIVLVCVCLFICGSEWC